MSRIQRATKKRLAQIGPSQQQVPSPVPTGAQSARNATTKTRISVCIDFGTTFTAVSYAKYVVEYDNDVIIGVSINPMAISDVSFASDHNDEHAFPSVCMFDEDGELLLSPEAEILIENARHSSNQDSQPELLRYIKLGLCKGMNTRQLFAHDANSHGTQVIRAHIYKLNTQCERQNEEVPRIIGQFLAHVYRNHVLPAIRENPAFGQASQRWPVDVVLTRPSIWSFIQDDALVEAAETAFAGITNIDNIALFDEGSAVAIGMVTKLSHQIEVENSDIVITVDLGGGTADISCLQVARRGDAHPRFREIVAPKGGCYGSAILLAHFGARFEEVVRPIYDAWNQTHPSAGSWPWVRIWDEIRDQVIRRIILWGRSTQSSKPSVRQGMGMSIAHHRLRKALQNTDAYLKLHYSGFDVTNDGLLVAADEVNRLFELCLTGIKQLFRSQLKAVRRLRISHRQLIILVVGGFSKNQWMQDQLKTFFASEVPSSDQNYFFVSKGSSLKSLTARGGVIYGADRQTLEKRVLQASIGFVQDLESDGPPQDKHAVPSRFFKDEWVTENCLKWVFKKNQIVGQVEAGQILRGRRVFFDLDETIVITEPVYYSRDCNQDHVRLHGRQKKQIIMIGELVATIDNPTPVEFPWLEQATIGVEGNLFVEVEYEIRSKLVGMRIEWEIRIPSSGHFDCKAAECPGAKDSSKCPGKGRYWSKAAVCNTTAALGSEENDMFEQSQEEEEEVDHISISSGEEEDEGDEDMINDHESSGSEWEAGASEYSLIERKRPFGRARRR